MTAIAIGQLVPDLSLQLTGGRQASLADYRGRPLVIVCNMGHSAADAARQLMKAGHEQVYRLDGGITAWRNDNLPVVKG